MAAVFSRVGVACCSAQCHEVRRDSSSLRSIAELRIARCLPSHKHRLPCCLVASKYLPTSKTLFCLGVSVRYLRTSNVIFLNQTRCKFELTVLQTAQSGKLLCDDPPPCLLPDGAVKPVHRTCQARLQSKLALHALLKAAVPGLKLEKPTTEYTWVSQVCFWPDAASLIGPDC